MALVEDELYRIGLTHIDALERAGINPYPAEAYHPSHQAADLVGHYPQYEGSVVRVAGRITSKRVHGNVSFADLEDGSGQIQTMHRKDKLGLGYPFFRGHFTEGDFIGTEGLLMRTRTGEVTVLADQNVMLAKAIRPIPLELKDPETQQRQRYLHTLIDRGARERFRLRSRLVTHMRDYFVNNLGCLEVETPIMDSTYGGANTKPFTTHHNALDTDLYLRIANELYLKRYTIGGFYEGVFEFSRDFRNEGMDRTHNPEFTQVELYKPFWDYKNMMDMAEDLMGSAALRLKGTLELPFGDHLINYKKPWKRISVCDGIDLRYGVNPLTADPEELRRLALREGFYQEGEVDQVDLGKVILTLFEHAWEKDLIQPTFVLDFPADTSALTKSHRLHPGLTERFEMLAAGMETMNCYTELNDPRDQKARFELEQQKRQRGDKETMPYDEDFILAQEYGMPQQAGIGISIDRWMMLLTNTDHIRQVIYFPTLKPKS